MSDGANCCRCCFSFIITSGLTALFMWLSLRTTNPKCIIKDFYVPALNTTDNSSATTNNHTVFFHLRLENQMKDKGVYYDNLNITIGYYSEKNDTFLQVANHTIQGFRQGYHKKANRFELVDTHELPWDDAYKAALSNKSIFRVDLVSKIRFKILFWKTKRHNLRFGTNVTVDYSGKKSGVSRLSCFPVLVALSIFSHFLTLLL